MIRSMFRISVFVFVTIRNLSWCLDINISNERLIWNDISAMNTTLLSKEFIANNGWEFLKTRLKDNELYWIGARGDYTPFVSWEGCVERFNKSEECDLAKYIASGSISKCIDKCTSNYVHFALQGSDCFCLDRNQMRHCTKTSSKDCGNPCLENPNDFCGGNDGVMTLYRQIKQDEVANEKANESGENCLILLFRNKSITYRSESCFKLGRRYICKGPNGLRAEDYYAVITWQQAFDACRQKTGNLYYKMSFKGEYDLPIYFWTSLKRSININWTTTTHGSTKCVAVTKTEASTIAVRLEKCKEKLQYLYVTDHKENSIKENEKPFSKTVIIIVLAVAFIALSAVTGGLFFFRRQVKRCCIQEIRQTENTTENGVAFNVYAEPESIYNTTVKAPEPSNRNYEAVPRDDVIRNGGYDVANYKGSLKPNIQCSGYGYGMKMGRDTVSTNK